MGNSWLAVISEIDVSTTSTKETRYRFWAYSANVDSFAAVMFLTAEKVLTIYDIK